MTKRPTEKPRVAHIPIPEGVQRALGIGTAEPIILGSKQVTLLLDALPDAQVTVCLEEGHMVGLVIRGELTARGLQRIPLRTVERYAAAFVRDLESIPFESEAGQREAAAARRWREGLRRSLESAPTRELKLARLAARYVQLCSESASPTKALAAELVQSPAVTRDQLAEARNRKMLTRPGSGRAGGELTPKALALLSTHEED